jgi:hypothetical protein
VAAPFLRVHQADVEWAEIEIPPVLVRLATIESLAPKDVNDVFRSLLLTMWAAVLE